jgi:putative phage-type endonuclease
MEQRTDEWYQARLGCVTASRTADILAKTKSGYSTSRANYMADLIVERLTGKAPEGFTSSAMQWGTETEPQARMAYEIITGNEVTETGFVLHPQIEGFGASPDGLVGEDGLVEIKCPNTNTHISTLLDEKISHKYVIQMHVQMLCTERDWCDFVSFDPRLPVDMQLFIKRVERDKKLADEILGEVAKFLEELDEKIEALKVKVSND